jgi:hypothetical protein
MNSFGVESVDVILEKGLAAVKMKPGDEAINCCWFPEDQTEWLTSDNSRRLAAYLASHFSNRSFV